MTDSDHMHRNGGAEQIHLPGASVLPLAAAIGITLTLVGLILTWWISAAGLVLTAIVIFRWISVVRDEIDDLPTERH